MSSHIELELPWSEAEAMKASKLYYDYDMRHSAKRYIGWLFVAMVQFGIVGALKHDAYGLLFISTFLVAYWYYGRWFLRKGMIRRFYKQHHQDNTHLTMQISQEGVSVNGTLIGWDEVLKVLHLEEGYLLQTEQGTLFIENRYFTNSRDKVLFETWAKEKEKL